MHTLSSLFLAFISRLSICSNCGLKLLNLKVNFCFVFSPSLFVVVEEEIDVVSLGEVLCVNPPLSLAKNWSASGASASAHHQHQTLMTSLSAPPTGSNSNNNNAPLRLKLKGEPIAFFFSLTLCFFFI